MGFLWHSPIVKVLYRAPSLITHTILRTDLMHEGARPRTSATPSNCVCRHANISQLGSPSPRLRTYLSPTWSALYCVYIRHDGRNVSQISWTALCSYSGT